MYFGWWRRQQGSNETFSYVPFAGIAPDTMEGDGDNLSFRATNDVPNFTLLTGSAAYRGPAAGQYAISQALGGQSGTGAFTARAEFTANFGTGTEVGTLEGTVTNFSNDSSWSLTLNEATMTRGEVASTSDAVDWTIGGNTSDWQGNWDAQLFSESDYAGQVPNGVVGTFTAIYDADPGPDNVNEDIVGAIIGAFGATK